MATTPRPIVLLDNDARTVELVHKAVDGLIDVHPLLVFPDSDSLRRYLADAERRPVAILVNSQREGTLSLMSWLDTETGTRVIYFGAHLSLPNFYRVDTLGEPLTEDVLTDALNGVLAEASSGKDRRAGPIVYRRAAITGANFWIRFPVSTSPV